MPDRSRRRRRAEVSGRERILLQAIHRGLKLIVDALGDYLKEPARTSR